MKIRMIGGLPVVSCVLIYGYQSVSLSHVLIDTGCANSIFDVDAVEAIGLIPNPKIACIVRMFGIGGLSEYCLQQTIDDLTIDDYHLTHFQIQLGTIKCEYGFDAILGIDFMRATGLLLDLEKLEVMYTQPPVQLLH